MTIQIKKRVCIPTDGTHEMNVSSTAYVSKKGVEMIRCMTMGAVCFQNDKRTYYSAKALLQRSTDNGATFEDEQPFFEYKPCEEGTAIRILPPIFVLDSKTDRLLLFSTSCIDDPSIPQFSYEASAHKTYRPFMRISTDCGHTWSHDKVISDERRAPKDPQWAKGLRFGENGAPIVQAGWLDDKTLLLALTVFSPKDPSGDLVYTQHNHTYTTGVVFAVGHWNHNKTDMNWRFSDTITVDPKFTTIGCNEPCFTVLDDGKTVFTAMRTQGNEAKGLYSRRYCASSKDQAATWSQPEILRYDDGDIVHNPASYSNFFVSSKTGRTYWIANILDEPVYGQTPRYPLHIALFDPVTCRINRQSVTVIQDLPPGAPSERRYTNWSQYEDRITQELVMQLPELPKEKNFSDMSENTDMQSDCLEYRIAFK